MLEIAQRAYSKDEVLSLLDPLVAEWFSNYPDLTPPQRYAVMSIHEGRNTLIASPTGSGKTLSAFLSIISELVSLGRKSELKDKVYCVYVSPLRSLNNDIYKNLLEPLSSIKKLGERKGEKIPEIRVGVRTGDTTNSERSHMLRKPPHILITTPESLAIILCAPKFREKLRGVKWVIIDEIHELCSSKRGVHLTLSLERLQELCGDFTRIGLSATIHPLNEIAKFLVGYNGKRERDCLIVDTRFVKPLELKVSTPVSDLVHTAAQEVTDRMYRAIKTLVKKQKTTLIFTNTRSGTERVVYHLSKLGIVDADELAAHHSSLSREIRKDVEDRLKEGKMKAVVTSTSLELGIDIGSIDLVVQIGSPKSISRCLQRVGRSGHTLDRVSRGYLIPLERDDLLEDALIVREALKGRLDRAYIPKNCLDVLAQHIVGMAIERKWKVKEAYELVKRSYCYRDLSFESFERVLRYLSGAYKSLEDFRVYGKIWYDIENQEFGRRGALLRVIYSTNIGTIPDEVAVKVYTLNNRWVGSIEEEFLERLSPGDIFILGGKTYLFKYAREFRAFVQPIQGEKPTVPTWFSEMLPLSFDLGEAIGEFRREVFEKLEKGEREEEILDFIAKETGCDSKASKAILVYIKAERDFLKHLGINSFPDNKRVIVEDFIDNENNQNIIFDCVFGRRVHDALARAYAQIITRKIGRSIKVTVSDSGFMLTLPRGYYYNPKNLVNQVSSSNIKELLIDAIKRTELVKRRFRHCATRALMVLRNYRGHEIKVSRQQANSQVLISLCEELDKFPILEETYREILEDMMDLNNAIKVLEDFEKGERSFIIAPKSDIPSPFTHDLILLGYSDVVLMEDKKTLLENLYDFVMSRVRKDEKKKQI
ncbi:MAG: ATP-dependent helicase [Nitrososphaerales archaeon]